MEPKIERGAAPEIHRVEDASVNWYLVEADSGLTIVDAGVPPSWSSLHRLLGEIGRDGSEVRAPRPHPRPLRPRRHGRARADRTDASSVLSGHGEPWRGGTAEAVRLARQVGPS